VKLIETSKFKKLRKKLKEENEKKALKLAIKKIIQNPKSGKRLKGEFKDLISFRYSVKGQSRRLIYKLESETIILFSFGPREEIYQ